jgi:CubicO group peptidase (beta-lactamase class C family)
VLRLVLILLLAALPVQAQDAQDKLPAFEQAFQGWLDQVGATEGILALRYDNSPVATIAIGRDAGAVDLASLSKAITGACIASLVDDGLLTYDTLARDVLDLRDAAPVTIGQLLSHASGLKKDHTQGPMSWWKDDPTPRWPEVTARALKSNRITGDHSYHYTNENYAVLGSVIEAVTGFPYEAECTKRVLDPAGAGGAGSDRFYAYLPWGGWQMTLADYAQVVDHWFGAEGKLADRLADLPAAVIEGTVSYGMGMTQRDMGAGRGRNVWHFGALCFNDGPDLGTFTARLTSGWTLAVWYDACVTWPDMIALDQALVGVAYRR